jgi:HSP20 family protein
MGELFRSDPFGEMRLGGGFEQGFTPDVEVKEAKDCYVFKADLPGVKEEDVEISVLGNRITISGKREEEEKHEDERYFACERRYGSFMRSFTLPEGVNTDDVKAEFDNGVLLVKVAKRPEQQPRRIPVQASAHEKAEEGRLEAGGKGTHEAKEKHAA